MLSCTSIFLHLMLLVRLTVSDNNFIFDGFNKANLSLNELAVITPSGLVRLTNDTKEGQGHAFYPAPLQFKNSSDGNPLSFSTTFVFAIIAEYPDVSGHGITFVISPSKELPGSMPSQHLGLFNTSDNGYSSNHIIAVELDTVKTVEFNDINDNHVGIDVNSLISKNSAAVAYVDPTNGQQKSLKLISGKSMQVWIDYNGITMQLNATVAPLFVPKPLVPLLTSKFNISEYILNDMYVGFSASTGAATGYHYILGWSFSLGGSASPLDLANLPEVPVQRSSSKIKLVVILAISVILGTVILSSISVGVVIWVRQRREKYAEILEDWEQEYGPHRFTYKDLYQATGGFDEEHFIGMGGFGRVYKGTLKKSSTEIAVKKISHESRQGVKEFVSEIVSMGRLRHRNLVQLLGYCRRQGELLLVYDYMPNGSLDKLIFNNETQQTLSWNQRFQIIKGVAAGLLYLHEGWEQVVIHRDIKSSNVLLDFDFNPKLGDFGLARLYDHGTNPQTTHIVGTLGYLAPELSKTGKATTRTDVYAFGAFLLEVACGRRPLEVVHGSQETTGLVDFVLDCWKKGAIHEARDQKLGKDFVTEEMDIVLQLGLLCSHPDPLERPCMKQAIQILEGDSPMPDESPERFISIVSKVKYDESFDDFLNSHPSTSYNTHVGEHTSPLFSDNH